MLKKFSSYFNKIDIKKINDDKFLAIVKLTNKSAYGKSIDEAIINLKNKINKKDNMIKKTKIADNSKKKSPKVNTLKRSENELSVSKISFKNFSYEISLHLVKLFITVFVFIIFTLIASNIIVNQLETRLSNITIIEKLENIANRFDNSLAEFNNELSDIRPLEKIEHEIIDMARPKNEIDPEKQKEIVDSLIILKKRIKPFLDAIKN